VCVCACECLCVCKRVFAGVFVCVCVRGAPSLSAYICVNRREEGLFFFLMFVIVGPYTTIK